MYDDRRRALYKRCTKDEEEKIDQHHVPVPTGRLPRPPASISSSVPTDCSMYSKRKIDGTGRSSKKAIAKTVVYWHVPIVKPGQQVRPPGRRTPARPPAYWHVLAKRWQKEATKMYSRGNWQVIDRSCTPVLPVPPGRHPPARLYLPMYWMYQKRQKTKIDRGHARLSFAIFLFVPRYIHQIYTVPIMYRSDWLQIRIR